MCQRKGSCSRFYWQPGLLRGGCPRGGVGRGLRVVVGAGGRQRWKGVGCQRGWLEPPSPGAGSKSWLRLSVRGSEVRVRDPGDPKLPKNLAPWGISHHPFGCCGRMAAAHPGAQCSAWGRQSPPGAGGSQRVKCCLCWLNEAGAEQAPTNGGEGLPRRDVTTRFQGCQPQHGGH